MNRSTRSRGASGRRQGAEEQVGSDDTADPVEVGRLIALDQLGSAPRTRTQLATAMRRRRVPDEAIEEVLERLAAVGLVDDAAFAKAWVTSRHAGRGLAPRALAQELRSRGVDAAVVEEAVAAVDTDDLETAAQSLVRRRAASTAGLQYQVRLRRLSAMLARKGYPMELALRAVREVLAAEEPSAGSAD